jgi:pimeloyl-ACP methyl ester carboxylesterase
LNVYFISGMGADQKAFSYIALPQGFNPVHLPWIKPLKAEPLAAYALRLAAGINTAEPFILVGLSMGGMIAVEIAKKFPPVCTILISSIPLAAQLPRYYRIAGKLKATIFLSPSPIKMLIRLQRSLIKRLSPVHHLVGDMFEATDNEFFKWSLTAVLQWDNRQLPQPLFHIHGTKDLILPIRLTHPTQSVPRAGHMLVMTHPDIINAFLDEVTCTRESKPDTSHLPLPPV